MNVWHYVHDKQNESGEERECERTLKTFFAVLESLFSEQVEPFDDLKSKGRDNCSKARVIAKSQSIWAFRTSFNEPACLHWKPSSCCFLFKMRPSVGFSWSVRSAFVKILFKRMKARNSLQHPGTFSHLLPRHRTKQSYPRTITHDDAWSCLVQSMCLV